MNMIGRFTVTASIVSLLLAPAAFAGQELDSQEETGSPQTHEQAPSSPMERDQGTLKPSAPTELTGQPMPGGKAPLFKAKSNHTRLAQSPPGSEAPGSSHEGD